MTERSEMPRRRVLRTLLQAGAAAQIAGPIAAFAQAPLVPTPACGAPEKETERQTEGPFFLRNSPKRQSLIEEGMGGERLLLGGRVLNRNCLPIGNALLEFWQADAEGRYDRRGPRLRGHQFTDAAGNFRLETVLPGLYPGRTRHIHVKVQAPGGRVLTTQIYFPDEPGNARDSIYSPTLLVAMQRDPNGHRAGFDFVVGEPG